MSAMAPERLAGLAGRTSAMAPERLAGVAGRAR
jgi:hypothetical protein